MPLLACPDCDGALRLAALDGDPRIDEELETGTLGCAGCGRDFPIEGFIPRLYPKGGLSRAGRRTRARFGWQWRRYPGALEEDRRVFLEETQIDPAAWEGKLALDAGCGMGRYARVALGLGARVAALDLSPALERLVPLARRERGLHVVQGDLLRPPFKPGVFDIAYSQGVLHHTPDTRAALRQVAALVKPDGLVTVWVYGAPGSWRSFSTNPLRPGRERLKTVLPFVWIAVRARRVLSDWIRVITTRLPIVVLYALCFPLALLGAVPIIKYLTFSVHSNFRVRLIENFDWLAPPYQHKHTKEEVRVWFEEEGLAVLKQLAHGAVPKVGFLGRKR